MKLLILLSVIAGISIGSGYIAAQEAHALSLREQQAITLKVKPAIFQQETLKVEPSNNTGTLNPQSQGFVKLQGN